MIVGAAEDRRHERELAARSEKRARSEGAAEAQMQMVAAALVEHGKALQRIEGRISALPCATCRPLGRRDTIERSEDDE